MSAIWGLVHRDKKEYSNELAEKMSLSMKAFKIDREDSVTQNNFYFACGHQYFTNEALYDVSPIFDSESGIVFAGDCYLYNRDELIKIISDARTSAETVDWTKVGDADLAYRIYKLFGERFVEKLQGSFSFAIYDIKNDLIYLYTDHVGQRSLFYLVNDSYIVFSSILQPIINISPKKTEINDLWIGAAFTDCTADTIKIPGITVFKDIYQVIPSRYVSIDLQSGSASVNTYWSPIETVPELKLDGDEAYRDRFVGTFERTIKSMMRPRLNVGVNLSGGLDSSTVAAFLARELGKEDKLLYTYTSIPVADFQYVNDAFNVDNESAFITAQKKMYDNICPRFVDYAEKNAVSYIDENVEIYAQPVKPVLNLPLINAMKRAAVQDECSIVFSGQNGNATISYGRILSYVYQKLCAGKIKDAYKECDSFCKRFRLSKKRFAKIFLKTLWEEKLFPDYMGDSNYLNKKYITEFRLKKINRDIYRQRGNGSIDSVSQRKHFCYMPEIFQHMGYFDTYNSLRYGVLSLDPTLSKPVIELCISMPIDCFVKNGKERRAIRDYMKGYVTDEILDNYVARGNQAADFAFCVNRDWSEIKDEVYDYLNSPLLRKYMDEKKLDSMISEIRNNEGKLDKGTVAGMAVLSSLSAFLKRYA